MAQARVQFRLSYGLDPESPFTHEGQKLRIDDQGVSQLSIWIESNIGEGFRPLSKIASGGELSRLMLSLLGAGLHRPGQQRRPLTLILDEVDAGVGGQTAIRVGEAIENLGGYHQVLSVTHLAQVAARSTHHLLLTKETTEGRTRSRCQRLEGESRIREIARLLSGESQKKETLNLAKSLLKIR
jgi:DNA repair protein RecN (Recombination protein N)